MSEMSDYMAKYFRHSRRKRGETMNEYLTRKTELYSRAQYSLSRVQSRYEPNRTTSSRSSSTRPQTWQSTHWDRHHRGDSAPSTTPAPDTPGAPSATEEVEPDANPAEDWHDADEGQWDDPCWRSWDYGRDRWNGSDWGHYNSSQRTATVGSWSSHGQDLLPDCIQGWFLLQDSDLDTSERNMIMAAIKQDFSTQRVSQELRNQWSDEDLRKRDQQQRGAAWIAAEVPSEDDEPENDQLDFGLLVTSGMTAEGLAVIEAAEDDAQDALAAIERNKRTLREARVRQHTVKMSRQYYKSAGKGSGRSHGGRPTDSGTSYKCLRCGGSHRSSACPQKEKNDQSAQVTTPASAPFVCYADLEDERPECMMTSSITTQEAMLQGKAVIDGGATRTLSSVAALERIMDINAKHKGDTGIQSINLEDRPTFGFGNSSTDRCLSTAMLNIQAGGRQGQLRVHTLDKGDGPLLFSIDALRSLGAVVDFASDLICFRKLDCHRIVQLERSATGHQLLPLTEDLFDKAKRTEKPVLGLDEHI